MRFESRELKPYAEPVSASALKEGSVYFSVNFVDEEMLIPVMEPVVFIGRNLAPNDAGRVYFQDIDSYRRGVRYSTAMEEDEPVFHSGSEDSMSHVFEFERALDVLMKCSLRRSSKELR
jgi:hypothetical protein